MSRNNDAKSAAMLGTGERCIGTSDDWGEKA
jgi:hypothetical protein